MEVWVGILTWYFVYIKAKQNPHVKLEHIMELCYIYC